MKIRFQAAVIAALLSTHAAFADDADNVLVQFLCTQALVNAEASIRNALEGATYSEVEAAVKAVTAEHGLPEDVFVALLKGVHTGDTSGKAQETFVKTCVAQLSAK